MPFRSVILIFHSGTNQQKLKTITKVHIDVLDEILYADDIDMING